MTADGWSDFLAMYQHPDLYVDSRIVYVSSSRGSDTSGTVYTVGDPKVGADPFEPAGTVQAYATIGAAYNQLRNGKPDILLLKRGDTWTESKNIGGKNGVGPLEPIIIGAYGALTDARPEVNTLHTAASMPQYVVVTSLEMNSGGNVWVHGDSVLFEDVFLSNVGQFVVQGTGGVTGTNLWLRRCVVHTGRIYAQDLDGFLVEECSFDESRAVASPYNHNVYLNFDAVNGVSRRNISARCDGLGWRQRGGGRIENNLIMDTVRNLGGNPQIEVGTSRLIVSAEVRNNVALYRRVGILFVQVRGGDARGNLVAHKKGDTGSGMRFQGVVWGDLLIENNVVYDWSYSSAAMVFWTAPSGSVIVRNNDLQQINGGPVTNTNTTVNFTIENNRYHSTSSLSQWFTSSYNDWVPSTGETIDLSDPGVPGKYTDPSRGIRTYMATLGRSSGTWQAALDAFMTEVRQQRRGYWRDAFTAKAVNAHIRAGFDMPAGGVASP